MQLTDWLLVEVALLLIGLTKIFFCQKLVLSLVRERSIVFIDYQLWSHVLSELVDQIQDFQF
jgi:hypothetical protein